MSQSKSVYILTGVDALINPNNIKPGMNTFDLKALEKSMIKGGLIQTVSQDPQDKLDDELKASAQKLGISFGDNKEKKPVVIDKPSSTYQQSSVQSYQQPSVQSNNVQPNNVHSESSEDDEEPDEDDVDEDDEDDESSDEPNESSQSLPPIPLARSNYNSNSDLYTRTQEQQRRSHIDTIVGTSSNAGFSFENEKREDLKCAMLSEIDILWGSLEEADVDLSRIPRVDQKSDYASVDTVLKMLRHKNDHSNYVSLAEELMLGGSYILESIFDGERTYFGKYRPNLTGYSNVLLTKFRRFRVENSQIVSSVMSEYNIGPGWRILMELLPSVISYSSLKSAQHNEPGLYSELDMQKANQHLRDTI